MSCVAMNLMAENLTGLMHINKCGIKNDTVTCNAYPSQVAWHVLVSLRLLDLCICHVDTKTVHHCDKIIFKITPSAP